MNSSKAKPKGKTASGTKSKPTQKDNVTRRWLLGFLFLFFSFYIALSVFSYILYWKVDQAVAKLPLSETKGVEVSNWGGRFGTKIGEWIVSDSFGVFGFLIPVVLLILALRVLRFRPVMLNKSVRICLMAMILGSVTLGYLGNLFSHEAGVFGTGLGGAHGIFIAEWIESYISYGTGLLLFLLIVFLAIYINRNTIFFINRVGKGIAEKSIDLTSTVAHTVTSKASEYIQHQKESRALLDEEETDEPEETTTEKAAPAVSMPAASESPFHNAPVEEKPNDEPLDYDYRYSEDAVEPITPIVRRPSGFDMSDDDCEFTVRTVGNEPEYTPQEQPAATVNDLYAGRRYREEADPEGFIIREPLSAEEMAANAAYAPIPSEFRDMNEVLDVLDSAGDERPESASDNSDRQAAYHADGADDFVVERHHEGEYENAGYDAAGIEPDERTSANDGYNNLQPEEGGVFPVRDYESGYDDSVPDNNVNDVNDPDDDLGLTTTVRMDKDFTVEKMREADTLPDDMIDSGFYDHTLDLSYYQKPPVELLEDHRVEVEVTDEELRENKNKIKETLENFGIKIDSIKATVGPTVTLYEIVPAPGVRISKIKNLENDIALSLAALGIRIIAPIPGKGTIGIEVPNKDKEVVSMYSAVKSVKFQESSYDLPVVLGRTIQNENYVIDLAKMPHLLVAGATGQGKSVGLNALITSLLYKKHPSELKFVMVDPKKVELTLYANLEKHFLAKMSSEDEAIITDTQKVVYTLNSLCIEMDARYDLLKNAGVRNLKEYNDKFTKRRLNPLKGHRYLPYIVVIIDEYADLLVTAGRDIETPLARIAQLARAVGIHLVIATQRPTADVITGLIKSNIPARIAFRVTSMMNSRTILDQPGAEQLIGRGDMLVLAGGSDVVRVQCAFVDTPEVERIMEFISNQQGYVTAYELPEYVPEGEGGGVSEADLTKRDALFEEAARLIVVQQQGSTSLIQRKFAIGYNRAGRIMDQLEAAGIVGRSEGSKPREVRITDLSSLEFMLSNMDTFR